MNMRRPSLAALAACLLAQASLAAEPKIATRGYFNLALDTAGQVWAWGDNGYGQLGAPVQSPQPLEVALGVAAAAVESYGTNSLVLDRDGGLWSFGENAFGQAGSGYFGLNDQPRKILQNVSKFSLGEHALAVRNDGSLWAWGRNYDGELGVADAEVLAPRQVGEGYADVAAGWGYSLALKADGSLYAWGINDCGQLGIGAAISAETRIATPTRVTGSFRAMSAGADHALALGTDGAVYAFGCNAYGQLGDGGNQSSATPLKLAGLDRIVAVVAGRGHSLALREDGTLYAWGNNAWGELARSDVGASGTPTAIGTGYSAIGGKGEHVLALKGSTLQAWGRNHMTQTGVNSDAATVATPNPLTLAGALVLAGGDAHSLAIDADGKLWAWGDNRQGQLGVGLKQEATLPLLFGTGYQDIAAGYVHALGIKADGSLWAWGSNLFGALADGTRIDRHTPVKIADQVAAVAVGKTESVMLKTDGSIWQWGDGLGHRNDPDAPLIVPAQKDSGYTQVTAGYTHFLGIKSDKSAWAWGTNGTCQLGDGDRCMNSETPIKVGDGYIAVAGGQHHSVGIKENGELWGWGDNEDGQLGVGPAIVRTPVKIGEGYAEVAAGSIFTVARKTSGETVGFGRWFSAACDPLVRCDPVALGTGFSALSAGQSHVLLRKPDGTVQALGKNFYGQLGDGTSIDSTTQARLVVDAALTDFLDLDPAAANSIDAATIPPFLLHAKKSGELGALSLKVDVRGLLNYPTTRAQQRADAGYNLYVAAQAGQGGALAWFQLDAEKRWSGLAWPMAQFMTGVSLSARTDAVVLDILEGANVSSLIGSSIYVGYGVDAAEMIAANRYRQVMTVSAAP